MNINSCEIILQKLVKSGAVRDAVLVSHEAELITQPMGEWDEESIIGMATAMLFLNDSTRKHLGWSLLEQMWLQAEEHYFIGIRCNNEVLFLVKAINAGPLGGLRIAINRTIKQLDKLLNSDVVLAPEEMTQDNYNGDFLKTEPREGEQGMWRGIKL